MKKRILGITLLTFSLISCANAEKNEETKVIKKVGKEFITEAEVEKELNYIGIKNDENLKKDIIESLIVQKILKQEAKNQGIDKEKSYKDEIKRMESMLLASLVVEKDVYQKVSKDETLLKKYYENNSEKFDFEGVKIAHIVIKNMKMNDLQKKEALKKAQDILEKALNGDNFYELAKKYSEAPDAKWGGEIGYITKGDMVTQIENVAFNNEIGVYNKIVETIYGYEIIFIADKKSKKTSLENLTEGQKNEIKDILLNDYYNEYIDNLKKKYEVEN